MKFVTMGLVARLGLGLHSMHYTPYTSSCATLLRVSARVGPMSLFLMRHSLESPGPCRPDVCVANAIGKRSVSST